MVVGKVMIFGNELIALNESMNAVKTLHRSWWFLFQPFGKWGGT